MTVNRLFLRGIAVGFFLFLTGSQAFGQSNRTWVAGGGTDPGTCAATVCTRSAPCATFQCALAATNAGGEIDALTPGDFGPGPVIIDKSISIVADGVLAGVLATGNPTVAIDVGGSNVVVVLRGLTLDGLGSGGVGIAFVSDGGVLHIEDCTINNFSLRGIAIEPNANSQIFIKDTIVRDNRDVGISFRLTSGTVTASLDNVRAERNRVGVQARDNVTVSVRNSVSAGNADAGFQVVPGSFGGSAVMNLESTIVSGNAIGIDSEGSHNTINITNVTVVDNPIGLSATNGGQIVSFGNNKITDNTTNGSPTKTISQK
jgi:hypothetical protein